MKKWVCSVCGYVHEGDTPPDFCPICKAPKEKFILQGGDRSWAAEHVVGVAKGAPEEILQGLRENFQGECSEVGIIVSKLSDMRVVNGEIRQLGCWLGSSHSFKECVTAH